MSEPGIDSPRYQALIQLLRTAETLWNASRVFFARWDLSPSQFNVLNLLSGHPDGCTQIDLSRQLIMHRSNVTGLVDRLEERGLVRRKDSATDRRAYLVALTPRGRALLEQILPPYFEVTEGIWDQFPVHRTRQLAGDLARLAKNVENLAHQPAARS